ncbi:MAG: hypothetical protein AAFQ75_15340, partial [Pseudomonadota bacterium]
MTALRGMQLASLAAIALAALMALACVIALSDVAAQLQAMEEAGWTSEGNPTPSSNVEAMIDVRSDLASFEMWLLLAALASVLPLGAAIVFAHGRVVHALSCIEKDAAGLTRGALPPASLAAAGTIFGAIRQHHAALEAELARARSGIAKIAPAQSLPPLGKAAAGPTDIVHVGVGEAVDTAFRRLEGLQRALIESADGFGE